MPPRRTRCRDNSPPTGVFVRPAIDVARGAVEQRHDRATGGSPALARVSGTVRAGLSGSTASTRTTRRLPACPSSPLRQTDRTPSRYSGDTSATPGTPRAWVRRRRGTPPHDLQRRLDLADDDEIGVELVDKGDGGIEQGVVEPGFDEHEHYREPDAGQRQARTAPSVGEVEPGERRLRGHRPSVSVAGLCEAGPGSQTPATVELKQIRGIRGPHLSQRQQSRRRAHHHHQTQYSPAVSSVIVIGSGRSAGSAMYSPPRQGRQARNRPLPAAAPAATPPCSRNRHRSPSP